jgi:hypothetical protein
MAKDRKYTPPQDPLDVMSEQFFHHSRAAASALQAGALGHAVGNLAAANYYLGRLEEAGQIFTSEAQSLMELAENVAMAVDAKANGRRR